MYSILKLKVREKEPTKSPCVCLISPYKHQSREIININKVLYHDPSTMEQKIYLQTYKYTHLNFTLLFTSPRKIFLNTKFTYGCYFIIQVWLYWLRSCRELQSSRKRCRPVFEQIWIPFSHPRIVCDKFERVCAKFEWNWHNSSE